MAIPRWTPAQEISPREQKLMSRHTRVRKLFVFLRLHRAELFDQAFQDELESMYRDTGAGKPPCSPALMGMAVILQGYERLSDADAVEHTASDARWQMVLDRMGQDEPAFAQGTLADFRSRLIRTHMDWRLLKRTVELAKQTKGFDYKKLPQTLRLAIDSAPLEGAGRVEDTINLLWHAARKLAEGMAVVLDSDPETICGAAGSPLLLGSSAKAALDRDWSGPQDHNQALGHLMDQVESLVVWMNLHQPGAMQEPALVPYVQALQQVIEQDLEPKPETPSVPRTGEAAEGDAAAREPQSEQALDDPGLQIREGVAKDRRISIEDDQMRHGRKSAHQRVDGYKRHVGTDLDVDLILTCAVTPANRPEEEAVPAMEAELEEQGLVVEELQIDQAYTRSSLAEKTLARGGQVICRPRRTRNGELFSKQDFKLDLDQMTVTCPAGQVQPLKLGQTARFDAAACGSCSLRARCTEGKGRRGRTLSIAGDERLQAQRREQLKTPAGRAKLRQRVGVEHRLSHIVYRQGDRARYMGIRKNLYDLRRASAIQNLETIQRKTMPKLTPRFIEQLASN
jgi:Transposase DDE domain/Transposase domain (DUF772)